MFTAKALTLTLSQRERELTKAASSRRTPNYALIEVSIRFGVSTKLSRQSSNDSSVHSSLR